MNYYRMQLHPDDSKQSSRYASESISAGFVGLGFVTDPGDLTKIKPQDTILSINENTYWAITDIEPGDFILIMSHHFPYALVKVTEGYNYIKKPVPELGIWFNHFVRVEKKFTKYYSDFITNPKDWQNITTTMTIQKLINIDTISMKVIKEMM
ncbi:hypothetical protein [Leptospira sp. GIMC2001]|uniref:hypothetical protein n=1 Tax=Leptospira sp. GIMC2001 TaxID=1513297 RepID=UPI00234A19D1|nr:hypothetical protein [Leptospira sp. GIMC2001]WCL50760.1 hypothetical protein O4O04_08090 [Leptospira sp. GIMC2001]